MNHEDIMLSKINQTQKGKGCMIPLIGDPRVVTFTGKGSRMVVARGLGKGEMEC